MRFHCAGTFGEYDKCFDLVVRKSDNKEYKSKFAYIRNGVSHTNVYSQNAKNHGTDKNGLNTHPENSYRQKGVWGQINMFADQVATECQRMNLSSDSSRQKVQ